MSGTGLSLLPFEAGSAPAAAAIHASAFDGGWPAEEIARTLEAPGTLGLGAWRAGRLAGFLLLRCVPPDAEVLTIAVADTQRRQGIGRSLLAEGCARALALGVRTVFLEVAEDNAPARAFYAAAGWRPVSRRPGYYRRRDGTGRLVASVDAIVLDLALPEAGSAR